jgi:hypothetical protein
MLRLNRSRGAGGNGGELSFPVTASRDGQLGADERHRTGSECATVAEPRSDTRDGLLWDGSTSRCRLLVYLPQELDPIVGCANYCREPSSPSRAIETRVRFDLSFQGSRSRGVVCTYHRHRIVLPTIAEN